MNTLKLFLYQNLSPYRLIKQKEIKHCSNGFIRQKEKNIGSEKAQREALQHHMYIHT